MLRVTQRPFAQVAVAASLLTGLSLTGCSTGPQIASVSPASKPGVTVQGRAHGGAYPIQYATVHLMETQPNGYGGAAKVLTTTESDGNGYFSFDNFAGCDAGQYVYVTVAGGQTIAGKVNNNILQMGVIGSCSATVGNPNVNAWVWITELSTVAAVYTLGNFMTVTPNDGSGQQMVNISAPAANYATAGCTGSGATGANPMTCTAAGLAHGFANAYNLVDSVRVDGSFPTGAANATFPNGANSQAIVPQAMINTIGNILQSCVDSAGLASPSGVTATSSDGTVCGTLFRYASTPSGSVPANTLQAAINIAKYPTHNVEELFNLQPPVVFFNPSLTSDKLSGTSSLIAYSLSVFYRGTGLPGDTGVTYPIDLALDASDSAYILYTQDSTGASWGAVDGLASNGSGLFAGAQQTAMANPAALALDNLGHAWVTDDTASGNVYGLYTSPAQGGSVYQAVSVPNGHAAGVAVDMGNNLWVSRDAADRNQSLFRFAAPAGGSGSYSASSFLFTPILNAPAKRLVVDYNQNPWGVTTSTSGNSVAFGFPYGANNYLALLESTPLATAGGYGVAVTRNMEAYFPLSGQLNSASGNTVGAISANSAGAYTGVAGSGVPMGTAIDGAGNIFWTDFESNGQVFMVTPTTGTAAASSGTLPGGTMIAFQPCFVVNGSCHTSSTGTNLRGMAIDSSGAMWYVADNSDYAVVQTLGLAAPTGRLLSSARRGSPGQ